MKPAPFDYRRVDSVEAAVALLAADDEARVLAGGQSLIPMLNLRLARPSILVDINRVPELGLIQVDSEGGLRIGAAVTQSRALTDPLVTQSWPLLAAALSNISHQQIRNRGTVCGSIAHNDPSAELPAVALALDATFSVRSAEGERTVSATEMFTGPFSTALRPGELLAAINFPKPQWHGWSFAESAQRRGDFATAGSIALANRADDVALDVRVVLFGVGGGPSRVPHAEQTLIGEPVTPEKIDGVAAAAAESTSPPADSHASSEYRRELVEHLVRTTLTEAWERAL